MSTLTALFGDSKILQFVAVFAALLFLAIFLYIVYRLAFGARLSLGGGGRARQPRLGLVDAFDLDRQRQLVIVRRDNVEHLILIGGPNDVVVEQGIVRAQPARQPDSPAERQAIPATHPGEEDEAPLPLPARPQAPVIAPGIPRPGPVPGASAAAPQPPKPQPQQPQPPQPLAAQEARPARESVLRRFGPGFGGREETPPPPAAPAPIIPSPDAAPAPAPHNGRKEFREQASPASAAPPAADMRPPQVRPPEPPHQPSARPAPPVTAAPASPPGAAPAIAPQPAAAHAPRPPVPRQMSAPVEPAHFPRQPPPPPVRPPQSPPVSQETASTPAPPPEARKLPSLESLEEEMARLLRRPGAKE